MKRFIFLLFIISVISLTMFTACTKESGSETNDDISQSQNTGAESEPAVSSEEENEYVPDLPDITYDGYEFRILNSTQDALHWMTVQLVAEQETGEALNDEIYHRNLIIEEKYGIKLTETAVGGVSVGAGTGAIHDQARKSIMAGSDDFDLIMMGAAVSLDLITKKMFVDFNNIPYVNLSMPWWDQNLINDITIDKKLYTVPGDFSLTHYSTTLALCFNKKLVRDYALDDPYQLVRENKWTLNKFFEMMKSSTADLNGDLVYDQNDLYGLSALHFVAIPSLSVGADMRYIDKDNNDIPILAIDNPSFVEKISAITDGLYGSGEPILFDAETEKVEHKIIIDIFGDNRALFYIELLHHSHYFREIDVDFGYLPHPKYDEAQENYITQVFDTTLMAVPSTSPNVERTGIILEALCAESRKRVIPAYYDKMLKTKIARDEESSEMLDILFSTRRADLGQFYWNSLIARPFSSQLGNEKNFNVASFIERNKGKIEAEISKTVDAFTSMAQ